MGDATAIQQALKRCCGSQTWAEQMTALRPFSTSKALLSAADRVWASLAQRDWLEAFAQHPKIGERSVTKWSSEEQRGMEKASTDDATAMHQLNIAYEQKFGWIFIVCATGKTADEMLGLLTARLHNDPSAELNIAAAEQSKITKIRLEKLLTE